MRDAEDVAWPLDLVESAGITVWLDGGWGADALLCALTIAPARGDVPFVSVVHDLSSSFALSSAVSALSAEMRSRTS